MFNVSYRKKSPIKNTLKLHHSIQVDLGLFERQKFFWKRRSIFQCLQSQSGLSTYTCNSHKNQSAKSVTTLIFVEIRTSIVNVPRVFQNAVAVSSDVSCPSLSWHFHLGWDFSSIPYIDYKPVLRCSTLDLFFVFGLNVALISPTKAASLFMEFFFNQVLNVKLQLVTNQRVGCLAFFGIPEIWLPKGQNRKQMTPWTPIDCLVPSLASYTEKMERHHNCIWLN